MRERSLRGNRERADSFERVWSFWRSFIWKDDEQFEGKWELNNDQNGEDTEKTFNDAKRGGKYPARIHDKFCHNKNSRKNLEDDRLF